MSKHHNVNNVTFEDDWLIIDIDSKRKKFLLKEVSLSLYHASDQERIVFEISPSGYGIHWPLLDEDISIDALLGIVHVPAYQLKSA